MQSKIKTYPVPEIAGAMLIEAQQFRDARGLFQKIYEKDFEFCKQFALVQQVNISSNPRIGTLRGMHYQDEPFCEYKIVSCIHGKIFDVMLDLRPESKNFKSWFGITLPANGLCLLIPPLVAHGFQTLENDSTVVYLHSSPYSPTHSKGINPFDSEIGITWPLKVTEISTSDENLPLLKTVLKNE